MPGFNIQTQENTKSINNKAEFRRKHRWRVTTGGIQDLNGQAWLYLQKAARPSFSYEEAVVHHDQEEAYFAGKNKWETIDLTFYDVEDAGGNVGDLSEKIFRWIAQSADANVATHNNAHVELPNTYKLDLTLQMTDGQGDPTETWTLFGCWPLKCNWQELDYTTSDVQTIVVTVRYDRAARE